MSDSLLVKVANQIKELDTSIQEINQTMLESSQVLDWSIIVPIILAFLGTTFTFLQLKFNKLSSARMEWVQVFRKNTSELLSISSKLYGSLERIKIEKEKRYSHLSEKDWLEIFFKDLTENVLPIEAKNKDLISNVRLMLNPNQNEDNTSTHLILDEKLVEYEILIENVLLESNPENNLDEIQMIEDDIIRLSRQIIKEAWEQAKRFIQ
ncbi:hypothetical protein A8B79_01870 [Balneola sp. EhC07]|uniref:hypothetical protein n=1 Tax=Balneola sp. EhC07 TaxID=1849360 RepID=UPI0007F43FB2|nr:hypothetical protein [Balneola sp. EhC07]OAN62999.1 hypothetical protein A8B79_01870 [Balneola sp. EhC07]